jgi:myo-inositol 2-dehydrogenase / D-chiro-inositol 1-dehydrogenase
MVLSVGVIGTGMIGTYHIERFTGRLAGARVAAVYDLDTDRAGKLAAQVGATAHPEPEQVVHDDSVDAVVVTSPGSTHARFVLEALAAGKPVFTEKPLATTAQDALEVMEAETKHGSRLVQVGFMRRFDAGYRQVKAAVEEGLVGEPLMVHNIHRNPEVPAGAFTSDMLQTDSVVHEVDVNRWLLDDEFVATTVLKPRSTPNAAPGLDDPQFVILETAGGVVATVEMYVNCQYGYDVRCEVVGSEGTAELETPSTTSLTAGFQRRRSIPADWRERFDSAFHTELQEWVTGLADGRLSGPSVWDGYAATVVTNACVDALQSGSRQTIDLGEKPSLYADG